MIWRPSLAIVLACALAGCGGEGESGPAREDWRTVLAARDGLAAEAALRGELDGGTAPEALAPFLGEAELLQGNLAEAERWLGGGAFAPEVAAHGFHMLGRLRMAQGDLPAAGRSFDQALAAGSGEPALWVDIGRLRWRGGEQAQAVEAAEHALQKGPESPAALLFRAQLMRDSHGNRATLPLIKRGLAAAPNDPDLLAERAATLGELGHATQMLAAARALSKVVPGDPRALYFQAVVAARAGRNDLARSLLQRSENIDRAVPAAMLLLALIDMDNANYASAAQGLDVLARRQPGNRRVQLLLARALSLGGNHRELVARFSDQATTPYLAMLVGRAHEALGERDRAAPYLDAAFAGGDLRLVPLHEAMPAPVASSGATDKLAEVVALVRGSIARGHAAAARREAGRYLARNPGSADAAALAGDAALAAGDADAAVRFYRRAAAIKRPWPLVKRMAAALDRAGQPGAATALVADHLAGEPANVDAAAILARRLLDSGEELRAARLLEYARSRGRNDPALERLLEG